jgi:hypothetical protein
MRISTGALAVTMVAAAGLALAPRGDGGPHRDTVTGHGTAADGGKHRRPPGG